MATSTAPGTSSTKPCARDRLLASANELFYAEGVHTVGIDRIIEHAGVAKASLYNTFGSKEELVRAYLEGRHQRTRDRLARDLAHYDDPRERLLGVFDSQATLLTDPAFRGCAFASASAEAPAGSKVLAATEEYRRWVRELFTGLARDAGAADPALLACQLQLLYDGMALSGRTDHDRSAALAARAAGAALLDTAISEGSTS
ncbi:MAG: TetR/AcrR family transcriptional regulator [Marmoricola sp.]